jgi:hypothetical protein
MGDLIFVACRGGWPDSINKKNNKDKLLIAYNYLDNICETDISNVDGVKRDPYRLFKIMEINSVNML